MLIPGVSCRICAVFLSVVGTTDVDWNRHLLSYQADQSGVYHERGGWLKGHHSGMPYWAQGSTTEMRPKNIAFNYIVKAS